MPPPSPITGLEAALSTSLARRRSNATIRQLTTNPPGSVDFSSNDFLSLATSPALRAHYLSLLATTGPFSTQPQRLGSGGSRLLDGNSPLAEQLERRLANFHNAPAALLANSGFDANVAIFSCLPQPGDIIVYDEFIHASVHDGMRLSRASARHAFPHNSVSGLHALLTGLLASTPTLRSGESNVFIAVETVYSMDGDLCPLAALVSTLHSLFPLRNAHLIVDEAHSTGLFGAQGRGLVSALNLEDAVTVRLHTFGKALACNGAVLLCRSETIRSYLVNYARPLIYTTFMSYPALAAISASYDFLESGRTDALATNLQNLIAHFHARLLDLQRSLTSRRSPSHHDDRELLQPPATCPQSPIFALLTPLPKQLAAHCQRHGFVVRGIVPPTVPAGTERIRVCLHAGNTVREIDALVAVLRDWVEEERRQRGLMEDRRVAEVTDGDREGRRAMARL